MAPLRHRPGFSLVELLVLMLIIAGLIGLTFAIQKIRLRAARMECSDHLRQIGLALQQYHDAHNVLPPGVSYRADKDPYPFMSWNARLLPFLGQESLWAQTERAYALERQFVHNPPHVGLVRVIPVFTCPADARTRSPGKIAAFTAYLGLEGVDQYSQDGVLFLDSGVRWSDVTDGASQTLMVGERPPSADEMFGWWYAGAGQAKDGSADIVLGVREHNAALDWGRGCPPGPYAFGPGRVGNQCDAFHFWSLHSGGGNFLFCDGSVHFLTYAADSILPALATRDGGEAVEAP
jgi:prepilin-type processing-associated H-X9-DG protein